MWPITIYDVTSSHISRLERLVNAQVRRWLGLPRCMSSVGLYVDGPLSLPISSLTEEYKCAKARLEMTLSESRDPLVCCAAPALRTGKKWTPKAAVADARAALRHRDIVGHVQKGRGGFGLGVMAPTWGKASPADIIKATYDILPTPANLLLWLGEDPACSLCSVPAGLKHILVGCKTSLSQGRYTWRYNQVLRCLASAIEEKRTATNAAPLNAHQEVQTSTAFIREGERQPTRAPLTISSLIGTARDWQLRRIQATVEELHQNLQPEVKSEEEEAMETISLGEVIILEERHQEEEPETSFGAIEEAAMPEEETVQGQTFKDVDRKKKKKKRK
ncbi:hypothetical protein SRHO_G00291360 [Serrasalmus rhombeus]